MFLNNSLLYYNHFHFMFRKLLLTQALVKNTPFFSSPYLWILLFIYLHSIYWVFILAYSRRKGLNFIFFLLKQPHFPISLLDNSP